MAYYTSSNKYFNTNNYNQKKSNKVSTKSDIFDNNTTLGNSLDNATNGTTTSSGVNSLLYSNGIYDRLRMGLFDKFSRIPVIDPYNTITNTKEYIFITKPDLCLLKTNSDIINPALGNNTFFKEAVENYLPVVKQLQSSSEVNKTPFMTILSNSLTSALDLPGISSDSVDTSSNIMGTKISYRGTSYRSDDDHDFSLEFEDNKYLDIYMLFKIYDEYERLKWNGSIDLASDDHWKEYITNRVLHDQMTIYKFIVDNDGMRILYWARITGCYPISVPRDSFSDAPNGPLKYTIQWKGNFVRDMDPIILDQFNYLVKPVFDRIRSRTSNYILPLYDQENHHFNGAWSSTPFITSNTAYNTKHKTFNSRSNTSTKTEYFLQWVV